ncbi:MAG: hypothetical protein HY719_05410 [Planctomycetes bacterium]|nr:hypothetical protein [Planctomycetota bacterium]
MSAYDPNGNVLAFTDQNGTTITTTYHPDHDLPSFVFVPLGPASGSVPIEDGSTYAIAHTGFNPAALPATNPWHGIAPASRGTSFERFKYDGALRMTHAENDASTVRMAHNTFGQVDWEIQQARGLEEHRLLMQEGFDTTGQMRRIKYPTATTANPLGTEVEYERDGLYRVRNIIDRSMLSDASFGPFGSTIATYQYAGAGSRLLRMTRADGSVTDRTYETADCGCTSPGRIKSVSVSGAGLAAPIAEWEYQYDDESNLLTEKWKHVFAFDERKQYGDATRGYPVGHAYEFDGAYRITKARYNHDEAEIPTVQNGAIAFPTGPRFDRERAFAYDGVGNRKTVKTEAPDLAGNIRIKGVEGYNHSGDGRLSGDPSGQTTNVSYQPDPMNEVANINGLPRRHDPNGNLIDDGLWFYRYDFKNRLMEARRKSDRGLIAAYEYDALGRRLLTDQKQVLVVKDSLNDGLGEGWHSSRQGAATGDDLIINADGDMVASTSVAAGRVVSERMAPDLAGTQSVGTVTEVAFRFVGPVANRQALAVRALAFAAPSPAEFDDADNAVRVALIPANSAFGGAATLAVLVNDGSVDLPPGPSDVGVLPLGVSLSVGSLHHLCVGVEFFPDAVSSTASIRVFIDGTQVLFGAGLNESVTVGLGRSAAVLGKVGLDFEVASPLSAVATALTSAVTRAGAAANEALVKIHGHLPRNCACDETCPPTQTAPPVSSAPPAASIPPHQSAPPVLIPSPLATGFPWLNIMIPSPIVTMPPVATRSNPQTPPAPGTSPTTMYPFASPTGSTMGLTTLPPGATITDVPETARPSVDTNDTRVRTLRDEGVVTGMASIVVQSSSPWRAHQMAGHRLVVLKRQGSTHMPHAEFDVRDNGAAVETPAGSGVYETEVRVYDPPGAGVDFSIPAGDYRFQVVTEQPRFTTAPGYDFNYSGLRRDVATGLHFAQARWYDAETGRFISRDPVYDPANYGNAYTYVGNRWTGAVDPWGRDFQMTTDTAYSEEKLEDYQAMHSTIMKAAGTLLDVRAIVQGGPGAEQTVTYVYSAKQGVSAAQLVKALQGEKVFDPKQKSQYVAFATVIAHAAVDPNAMWRVSLTEDQGIIVKKPGFFYASNCAGMDQVTRGLTRAEISLAKEVFGKSVDLSNVLLVLGSPLPNLVGRPGMTPGGGSIHLAEAPGTWDPVKDLADQALFIHEMTHVWQAERAGVADKNLQCLVEQLRPDAYRYDVADVKKPSRFIFNMEGFAEAVKDAFFRLQFERNIATGIAVHGLSPFGAQSAWKRAEAYAAKLKRTPFNPAGTSGLTSTDAANLLEAVRAK